MANSSFLQAPKYWEKRGLMARLLWPVSKIFEGIVALRKALYDLHLLKSSGVSVPLVIVGNLRVGGTGKTPSVLAIAKTLKARGFHPGIISRGYRPSQSSQIQNAIEVNEESLPSACGDEPCYMAQQLRHEAVPIFIHPKRALAAQALLEKYSQVDVIICDDGLQHYALKRWPAREGGRDIELVVRDIRGEGNAYLLPAGPLRESADRSRDFTLNLGAQRPSSPYLADAPNFDLKIETGLIYQLQSPDRQMKLTEIQSLMSSDTESSSSELLVAAGMGNPEKFFDLIRSTGLSFEALALPDHYDYAVNPFEQSSASVILITEKDAVKCAQMPQYREDSRIWVLPVTVELPEDFVSQMVDILKRPQP